MSNLVKAIENFGLAEAEQYARHASKTGFFNAKSVHEAVIIIMAGKELGMPAVAALQSFHVIKGKPSLSAHTQRAMVMASPLCERFDIVEMSSKKCRIEAKRRNGGSLAVDYTIEDAKQAGLNTDMWKKYPRQMLLSRATTEVVRALFPDVLHSTFYTPEEIREFDDSPAPRDTGFRAVAHTHEAYVESTEAARGSQVIDVEPEAPSAPAFDMDVFNDILTAIKAAPDTDALNDARDVAIRFFKESGKPGEIGDMIKSAIETRKASLAAESSQVAPSQEGPSNEAA